MYWLTIKLLALVLALETMAYAQRWQPPSDSQRCPSKWGAGDQRGSGNHMSRETVLRATKLIRTGEVFELGHVLNDSMPLSQVIEKLALRFDLASRDPWQPGALPAAPGVKPISATAIRASSARRPSLAGGRDVIVPR